MCWIFSYFKINYEYEYEYELDATMYNGTYLRTKPEWIIINKEKSTYHTSSSTSTTCRNKVTPHNI